MREQLTARGVYLIECRDAVGRLLWRERIDNLVTTVGKNALLAAAMQGASYTVVGPYMLLISSASFTAVSASDTMTSHAGWLECGGATNPVYGTVRPTLAFNAPSGGLISVTAASSFTFTSGGTVQGVAAVFGTGALATVGNTGGTLLSAGVLATPQPVIATNVVNVTWSLSV